MTIISKSLRAKLLWMKLRTETSEINIRENYGQKGQKELLKKVRMVYLLYTVYAVPFHNDKIITLADIFFCFQCACMFTS